MAFVFRSRTPPRDGDDDDVNDEAPTLPPPACALPTTPRSAPTPPRALYFLSRAKETNREDTAACIYESSSLVAENEAKNESMKKSLLVFLFSRASITNLRVLRNDQNATTIFRRSAMTTTMLVFRSSTPNISNVSAFFRHIPENLLVFFSRSRVHDGE